MAEYLRFHVRLLGIDADLWRRFLLTSKATFADLHQCIQLACGWEDCHLYAFRSLDHEALAGIPDAELGPPDPDAARVKLATCFGGTHARESCLYEYDFGDSWLHEIKLEGVEPHAQRFTRRLLDGAGTFPPEDCGSVPGYERCVAAVTGEGWHGDEDEREELLDWLGDWRPDQFDLAALKKSFDA